MSHNIASTPHDDMKAIGNSLQNTLWKGNQSKEKRKRKKLWDDCPTSRMFEHVNS